MLKLEAHRLNSKTHLTLVKFLSQKKCDQIFGLVRRKKAALVWRNPMGYARPLNSSIIDFLSQVYSRFAVRATMSLIFDLRKIGTKWNSVSFFGYSTRTSKYGKKENGRQTNFVMKETVFCHPVVFQKLFWFCQKFV